MDYTAQGIQQLVRVQIIDRATGRELAQLDGVKAASVDWDLNRAIRGGGSVTVDLRQPVLWRKVNVRLWVVLRHRGQQETHPMLTGIPAVSESSRALGATRVEVVLQDMTSVLDRLLGRTWMYPVGTVVTTAVRAILATLGVPAVSITDSTLTTRAVITADPGDTYRRLINDLLEAAGYGAIYATPRGALVAAPYALPADRPDLAPTREPGLTATHKADLTVSITERIPNHFVVLSRGDGESPQLIAEGFNDDPDNPWSTVNQGVISAEPYDFEAADQATLNGRLARIMSEWRWRPRMIGMEWRWAPISATRELELGDVGRVRAPGYVDAGVEVAEPIDIRASVESMSWSYADGQPLSAVRAVLKEVG